MFPFSLNIKRTLMWSLWCHQIVPSIWWNQNSSVFTTIPYSVGRCDMGRGQRVLWSTTLPFSLALCSVREREKKTVPSCGFRNELLLERNKRVGYVFQLFQTVDPFLWLLNNRTQIAGYMAVQTKPLCGEYRTVSLFCKKSGTILLPQVLCVSEFFMYQFVTCAG